MSEDFAALRQEVFEANVALPRAGLVTMHSGNASGVHRGSRLALIKPSGVDYESLRPEDLVVVDLAGTPVASGRVPDGVQSPLRPSVDTVHHVLLYAKDATIGGVVHTHSNFATAWATVGEAIPCALTAIADEFGAEIPCAPYLDNEAEHIAEGILRHRNRGPAILLARHGVFTFDATPRRAFKAAVMVEDVAKTLWLARSLGPVSAMDAAEVEKWWTRYHGRYGQE